MSDIKTILVVGDVITDEYRFVTTERKAAEENIPVWDEKIKEKRLGGAANVAANLTSLKGPDHHVYIAGLLSDIDLIFQMQSQKINTYFLSSVCVGRNLEKTRFVDAKTNKILFRSDNRKTFQDKDCEEFSRVFKNRVETLDMHFDLIVVSDYDKGTVSQELMEFLKDRFPKSLFVVDSKKKDLRMFKGMNVLKINELEYSNQVSNGLYNDVCDFFENVVVTKGPKGAELRQSINEVTDNSNNMFPTIVKKTQSKYITMIEQFPTIAVNAVDVTGCGDTHTAALSIHLLDNKDIRSAIKFANECSRVVVQKFGTSVVKL